jgi:hypothetical protein
VLDDLAVHDPHDVAVGGEYIEKGDFVAGSNGIRKPPSDSFFGFRGHNFVSLVVDSIERIGS